MNARVDSAAPARCIAASTISKWRPALPSAAVAAFMKTFETKTRTPRRRIWWNKEAS
jgi:hypothetical protein